MNYVPTFNYIPTFPSIPFVQVPLPSGSLDAVMNGLERIVMPEVDANVKQINQLNSQNKYIRFEIDGYATSVYCTHPSVSFLQPNVINWVYKYNNLDQFNSVLRSTQISDIIHHQYESFLSVLPECASYSLPHPIRVYKKVFAAPPGVKMHSIFSGMFHSPPTVIELEIPPNTVIIENIRDGKCRSPCAITKSSAQFGVIYRSLYDPTYVYPAQPGQLIFPKERFDPKLTSCSNGIHYFKTYDDALDF